MAHLKLPLFILISLISFNLFAQGTAINTSGNAADGSAILDVSSTSQGMLCPRMTAAQRSAISAPATGLLVYQTDGTAGFYFNSGTSGSPVWTLLENRKLSGTYPAGIQVFDASSATDFTVTDLNVRYVFLDCKGVTAASKNFVLTLPSASSYLPGTIIAIATNTNSASAPGTFSLISLGSTLNSSSQNNTPMNTQVSTGVTAGGRYMSDGISKWYRLTN
ncbi:MAG: hypothetical protein Q8940_22295 [Bacteroidota bacterium]|nr:hypothetical protein [Bacteroidota bacterium]